MHSSNHLIRVLRPVFALTGFGVDVQDHNRWCILMSVVSGEFLNAVIELTLDVFDGFVASLLEAQQCFLVSGLPIAEVDVAVFDLTMYHIEVVVGHMTLLIEPCADGLVGVFWWTFRQFALLPCSLNH